MGGKTSYMKGLIATIVGSRINPYILCTPGSKAEEQSLNPEMFSGIYWGINRSANATKISEFKKDVVALSQALRKWSALGFPKNMIFALDEFGDGTNSEEMAALTAAVVKFINDHGGIVILTANDNEVINAVRTQTAIQPVHMGDNYQLMPGYGGSETFKVMKERLGFGPAFVKLAETAYAATARHQHQEAEA